MNRQKRGSNPIDDLLPIKVEGFAPLAELALDVRWSWNHAADDVWRQLDPDLWELTHNPWGILQTVSRDRIERLSASTMFVIVGIGFRCGAEPACCFGNYRRAQPGLHELGRANSRF